MTTLREAAQQALEALEKVKHGQWEEDSREGRALITALRAALEQPEQEPAAISWVLDGDKDCGYNNWLGITPFGRILITWKGWKEHLDACVDEFPGVFQAYGEPDYVKAACEAEYIRRLGRTHPPRREWRGLTDEEMEDVWMRAPQSPSMRECLQKYARAIEAALKERNV
jgi:predicted Fe-S protein YdhL (DUF1289 family)